jgi:hypothetical protein
MSVVDFSILSLCMISISQRSASSVHMSVDSSGNKKTRSKVGKYYRNKINSWVYVESVNRYDIKNCVGYFRTSYIMHYIGIYEYYRFSIKGSLWSEITKCSCTKKPIIYIIFSKQIKRTYLVMFSFACN